MTTIDMSLKPMFPTRTLMDTVAGIHGDNVNTSLVACAPFVVQIGTLAVGTTVQLQGKSNQNAEWVPITDYDATSTPTMYIFDIRVNFVRLVRTGAGDVKVHSQGA